MEINVKMTAEEFREFMTWREKKDLYKNRENELRRDMSGKLEKMASKVMEVMEEIGKTDTPEYRIKSQDAAVMLWEDAVDVFA